ncbi:MAG: hypothetical protein UX53_C0036G0005 [Candidatus Azambacteria bacterium GW2011_GWB2_46_37]|uniref:Uncharacterized protein n=1 Tax=Candidatus Azambacteria bacterium GW2011_GWB2_46_37 TaxID=1618618 RepID=A0A0G1PYX5_9BACT|nr:MAG: hypothetical protein UX53_C0036G0005 [Candidatus Azambacteria bacterium GW2011_GWB2_46_37]
MAVEIDYYITMVSKIKSFVNTKGSSSLPAHWEGGARATVGAKSEGAAEGGCGGNSAAPERNKTEASPAALLVQNRTPQKSFLFLLEEKIRRAQIRKSEENFFVGWRATARGGRAASLVPFKVGSRKVYNYSTNKKDTVYSVFFVCARERSRTSTPFGATTSR